MSSETLISHFKTPNSPLNSPKLLRLAPPPPSPPPPPPPPPPHHPTALQSMFSSNKSSKWLHRLRASRGFPESDHIDLDHFLSTCLLKIDPIIDPVVDRMDSILTRKTPLPEDNLVAEKCNDDDDNGATHGRDLITNVLSDLFYMGEFEDRSGVKRKKSCRKQQCPRICVVSNNLDVQNVADGKERGSSALTLISRRKVREVKQVSECVEEEEGKGRWDLSAYSQTEVTVIDTSVACWKFEKVLYRRKNVWKVGDKKGKGLMSADRKKRKERMNEGGGDVQKKKLKKKLKLCSSLKYVGKEESMVPSKFDQGRDQGKVVAANEKKRDSCSQVQEKSFCKKQIDEGSSVILIKSIPTTNKKNALDVSSSGVKSTQR